MKNSTHIVAVAIAIVFATASTVVAGDAFSFGKNDYGQLGLNSTISFPADASTPIITTNVGGRKLSQVSAGSQHSLLLADDGSVFSFGSNVFGQLGLGTGSPTIVPIATLIDTTNLGGRKITQVAAGSNSLILADDGSVFSFGGNSSGQLGLGVGSPTTVPVATPIDTTNLGGRKITQVAAGLTHNLLLAEDGSVFSFGSSTFGKLGLGTGSPTTVPVATPIDTTNLGGRKITQVAAGANHSLLLAEDGSVFSFGMNFANNSLGQGTISASVSLATPIDTTNLGGHEIIQIAAGQDHSLLLADDGSVYSFGFNAEGITGLGTNSSSLTTRATPIATTNLGDRKITQVAAGAASTHSLLLAEDGSVFSFGSNLSHQLGLGAGGPSFVSVATPINTTNLGGLAVTQIATGGQHSLLIAVLPGDFNHDDTVDAADYVVWRKNPGGVYTPDDYTTWRANFGQSFSFATGSGTTRSASVDAPSVPEPLSIVLACVCALTLLARRKHSFHVSRDPLENENAPAQWPGR